MQIIPTHDALLYQIAFQQLNQYSLQPSAVEVIPKCCLRNIRISLAIEEVRASQVFKTSVLQSHGGVTWHPSKLDDNCSHVVVVWKLLEPAFVSVWWCMVWVAANLWSGLWESDRRYWYRFAISRPHPPFSGRQHSLGMPVCCLTCPPL